MWSLGWSSVFSQYYCSLSGLQGGENKDISFYLWEIPNGPWTLALFTYLDQELAFEWESVIYF